MKKLSTLNLLVLAAVLSVIALFLLSISPQMPSEVISSFEECADAGFPIMESYPERCRTPDGQTFTREVTESVQPVSEMFTNSECVVTGCGSLCVSESDASNHVMDCSAHPEDACYAHSLCRMREDGSCGWAQSGELNRCLKEYSVSAPAPDSNI